MKITVTCLLFMLSTVLCEPPVPSSQYLPASNNGYNVPSITYNNPSNSLSQQYGVPNQQYGPPSQEYGAPSQQYGAPSQQYGAPSQQYGPPSQQYGPPSQQYEPPSQQYGPPGQQYELPIVIANRARNSFSRRPSSNGNGVFRRLPSANNTPNRYTAAITQPSSTYGVPNGNDYSNGGYNYGRANGYDDQSEPANYQFEYTVSDTDSNNDFGHMEERQGDQAQGRYYVLLPDGRRQIVDYEADADGFKSKISYEDIGRGYGGRSGDNGGYHY